jgi:hypothetical protein
MKVLDKINSAGKTYYSIAYFMEIYSLKTRKTVYDWLTTGKAEKMKIGPASFFRKV